MNNKAITLIGKISVFDAGHKGTAFRDSNGDHHAEFYKASVGVVAGNTVYARDKEFPAIDEESAKALGLKDGEFYSFRWNVKAEDAETIANQPMGTIFKVIVTAKMTRNAAGAEVVDRYENNFDVKLRDLDIIKEGSVERKKYIKFLVIENEDGEDGEDGEDAETAEAAEQDE